MHSATFVKRKSISRNSTYPQSFNLQSTLTGEMLKGQSKRRESNQSQY